MATGLNIIKNLLGLHDEGGNKLSGKSSNYTLINENQNDIIDASKKVTYQVKTYQTKLLEFVHNYSTHGTPFSTVSPAQYKEIFQTISLIEKHINTFFESYLGIVQDVDSNNVDNDRNLLSEIQKLKKAPVKKTKKPKSSLFLLIRSLPSQSKATEIEDKIVKTFNSVDRIVDKYIKFKKSKHQNIAQTIHEEVKGVLKQTQKNWGTVWRGGRAAAAGGAMSLAGGFLGHFFKSEKLGSIAKIPGEAFLARTAIKAENFRDKQHGIIESVKKLQQETEQSKIFKKISSKFGGGGSYKALRSSTVMVGDNPGGRESVSIGNNAFKTNGPSLLRIRAGQSIHANPLSGMGKTRINPGDFDALGGGTEAPLTATANTDRITDALDKNTEILELIYKEQHNKYKEDRKIGRKKTLGEHVGGFIDSPDKKGYIKNLVNKSSLGETSLGDKTIGEHVGGFLDAADKKGYIKNVIKDKTINKLFGKGKGIAEGIGEAGNLAKGAEAAGGLAEAAGGAEAVAGGAGLLATAAPVALTAAAAGLLGWGGYKMATGHNAGVAPESMLPSMGGSYTPSYSSSPEQLANAIKKTESGGKYGATGASGEHGAYQYMPGTWDKYSSQYAKGTGVTGKVEMTPANQGAVTQYKIKQWKAQGLSDQDIAAKWNAGEGVKNWQNKIGVNSKGVAYNTPAYVNKVMGNVQAVSPTATNPVPVTPAKLAEKQLEVVKAQADIHTKAKTEAQAKKDAIAKAASKTTATAGSNTKNVTRDASAKGNTILSSGDSSLINMFNAQWGRS